MEGSELYVYLFSSVTSMYSPLSKVLHIHAHGICGGKVVPTESTPLART